MTEPYIPHQPEFLSWPKPDGIVGDPENGIYEFDLWQQGRCAICGTTKIIRGARVQSLDHDHDTGLVRGRLCSGCNVREGRTTHRVYALWRNGMNPCAMFGWYYAWERAPYPPRYLGEDGLSAHLEETFLRHAYNKARRVEARLRRALSNGA
jgi:hypothetical protein